VFVENLRQLFFLGDVVDHLGGEGVQGLVQIGEPEDLVVLSKTSLGVRFRVERLSIDRVDVVNVLVRQHQHQGQVVVVHVPEIQSPVVQKVEVDEDDPDVLELLTLPGDPLESDFLVVLADPTVVLRGF
jgi:hypothetical protein